MTLSPQLLIKIAAQNQTQAAFGQLNSSLNNLKTQVLGVVGALAGGLAFKDIIDSTMRWGNEVDRLRDELGGTAEEMSKLNFVGQSVGLTTDELSQTFGILSKRIADSLPEIAKGTSVFDKWGIKLTDASGEVVDFAEAMRRVKDRFQEVGQNAQGTALLLDVFGRSGKTLSDFLALTDAQMKQMTDDAQSFGLVLDAKGTDTIEAFRRSLLRLQLQFEGLKLQLGQFLIPLLSAMIEKISKGLTYIKSLGEAIGRMLAPLKEWIDKLGGVKAIGDALLTVGVALVGLAVLGGMIALGSWLVGLVGMAIPLVAVASGIALIALAIKDIADAASSGQSDLEKATRIIGDMGAALIGLAAIMVVFNAPAAIVIAAIGLVGIAISEVGTTILLIKNNWDTFVTALTSGELNNIPVLGRIFSTLQLALNTINAMIDASGVVAGWWGDILNWVQAVIAAIRGLPVIGGIIGGGSGGGGGGGSGPPAPPPGMVCPPGTYPSPDGIGGWTCLLVQPGFAAGGIVTQPMNALVGEAGPEAIIPLSKLGGGLGGVTIVFNAPISANSPREVADMISDEVMRRLFSQRQVNF